MQVQCILQYESDKVQYIGTKNISQYIVVTINRTIRKLSIWFYLNFFIKSQKNVLKLMEIKFT